jgi:hypothetical protein
MGGERGFDHPGFLQFDGLGAWMIEQPDAITE